MTTPDFSPFYKTYVGSGEDFDPSFFNSVLVVEAALNQDDTDDYSDIEDLVQAG